MENRPNKDQAKRIAVPHQPFAELIGVVGIGATARLQLSMLRLAARFGHIRQASKLIARFFPASNQVEISFSNGGTLRFPLGDSYWARLAVGWEHEPEMKRFIDCEAAEVPDALFVDCGANIGYWPVRLKGSHESVAVEAAETTFKALQEHATRNGFKAIHAAIWPRSGETVAIDFTPKKHAGASVADDREPGSMSAPTLSLDDLLRQTDHGGAFIVKLDIEGLEAEVIRATSDEMRSRCLFIYEDHGKDRLNSATASFLDAGFEIVFLSPVDDSRTRIGSASDLTPLKADANYGYNLAAYQLDGSWDRLVAG